MKKSSLQLSPLALLLLLFGFRFRLFHVICEEFQELLRMSHKSSKWFYVFLWCSPGMKETGLCELGLDSIFKYIFWGFRGFERQQNYFEIPLIRFFFLTQKQQTSLQSKNGAWHTVHLYVRLGCCKDDSFLWMLRWGWKHIQSHHSAPSESHAANAKMSN